MRFFISLTTLLLMFAVAHHSTAVEQPPHPLKNNYKPSDLIPFLEATEWTIFSLDPILPSMNIDAENDLFGAPARLPGEKPVIKHKSEQKPKPKPKPNQLFHDYLILGQTKTTVTSNLKTVITTLEEASRNWGGGVAGCFTPRHGIRVFTKDGTTHDLLICYECMRAHLFQGEKITGTIQFAMDPNLAPRPAFLNGALILAKVKLPSR